MALADFNQDGKLDIAVANNDSGNVSLLRNTTATNAATPTFAAQQTLAANALVHVAVGDFNTDGKPDLVVCNRDLNTVSIFLNTTTPGAASFSFTSSLSLLATGVKPRWAAVGDLNNDGKPDLVVANVNASTVSVFRNTTANGGAAPSFDPQGAFGVGAASQPRAVTLADVNGDGKLDLIVADQANNKMPVRLNTTATNATTFSFASTVALIRSPSEIGGGGRFQ